MASYHYPSAEYLLEHLSIGVSKNGITHITYVKNSDDTAGKNNPEITFHVYDEIKEYLEGKRQKFTLKLDFSGITPFYKKIYDAAMAVPYGETRTYKWLAEKAGSPHASRAAGSAMAKNPFLIVMPCHRILRSDGGLGGFGPGLEWKTFLINHEKRYSLIG